MSEINRDKLSHVDRIEEDALIYNQIFDAVSYYNKYKVMANAQLANELMLDVWAKLPMWSEFSELLEVVIERLQGNEEL